MKLLIKPTFLLVALSGFTSMLGFFVPLFYLPDMAQSNGITNGHANFLLSIYGKRLPLRLDQNFDHLSEGQLLITDQQYKSIFPKLYPRFSNEPKK